MSYPQIALQGAPPLALNPFQIFDRATWLAKFGSPAPPWDPNWCHQSCFDPSQIGQNGNVTYNYVDTSDPNTPALKQFTIPAARAAAPNLAGEEPDAWHTPTVEPTGAHYFIAGISSPIDAVLLCTQQQANLMLAELKGLDPNTSCVKLTGVVDYTGDARALFNFSIPSTDTFTEGGLLWAIRSATGVDVNGNPKPGAWTLVPNAAPTFAATIPDTGQHCPWSLPQPVRALAAGETLRYEFGGVVTLETALAVPGGTVAGGYSAADRARDNQNNAMLQAICTQRLGVPIPTLGN
jgi:hypothetical protein